MMRLNLLLPGIALALFWIAGCATAQRPHGRNAVMRIDGQDLPLSELYPDNVQPITIRPIGVVVNDKHPGPADFGITGGDISEIRLYPGMARFMKGLEDESSLLILWHFHKAEPIKSVFARGWDGKRVGPFASRTPNRPTPIGATVVDLLEVKGTTLIVRGLDAYNGTPVLDIKVAMKSLRRHPRSQRTPAPAG
jgi:tRNA-Thr(GGU) m(6)t(6)A37 methyltransferase TsaA